MHDRIIDGSILSGDPGHCVGASGLEAGKILLRDTVSARVLPGAGRGCVPAFGAQIPIELFRLPVPAPLKAECPVPLTANISSESSIPALSQCCARFPRRSRCLPGRTGFRFTVFQFINGQFSPAVIRHIGAAVQMLVLWPVGEVIPQIAPGLFGVDPPQAIFELQGTLCPLTLPRRCSVL